MGYWRIVSSNECTAQPLASPHDDTITITNTTNGSIILSDLYDDTCYVFGVRVYSEITDVTEKWIISNYYL